MAQLIQKRTSDHPPAAFALVAEEPSKGIVGAIACGPPYRVIEQAVVGGPRAEAPNTELYGLIGVSKLFGVAVREDMQHAGIGNDLVWAAEQVLRRCGTYMMMYGSCSSEVTPFYQRLGFTVEPREHPVNLWVVFGFSMKVSTPGMHIFSKQLQAEQHLGN